MQDAAVAALQDRIRAAGADRRPLRIHGGATKDFYGHALEGDPLDVRGCAGIVAYAPAELVITARAGTPLAEIEDTLEASKQMLAFEPPRHGTATTLGGVVAAGLSGPRRASAGALRDFVLGVRIVDGTGEPLAFGGQVMKNVAGFDVSRLMAGALGTLGVLTEISLKCTPRPRAEVTRLVACSGADAIRHSNDWGGKPLPVSATCFHAGKLWVRLSGAGTAVASAAATIGGDEVDGSSLWRELRDQALDFFVAAQCAGQSLWRLSVRSTAPWAELGAGTLAEWGGALRWVATDAGTAPQTLRDWAERHGGHATLYRAGDKSPGAFHPPPEPLLALHRRLKDVFDPQRVLNRGRLYPGF